MKHSAGLNPEQDLSLPKKTHGLVELVSVLIHLYVYIYVHIYKMKAPEPHQQQQLSQKRLGLYFNIHFLH